MWVIDSLAMDACNEETALGDDPFVEVHQVWTSAADENLEEYWRVDARVVEGVDEHRR